MLTRKHVIDWIAALRSGEYRQGESYLARMNTDDRWDFCCLGVLCEKVKDEFNLIEDKQSNCGSDTLYKTYNDSSAFLPYIFKDSIVFYDYDSKLIQMNDEGKSFKYIAYYIERYILPKVKD